MLIILLYVMTRGMYLWIIFFIKRKVLNRLHNVPLSHVNHCLDVINETLMLNLGRILYSLLYFDRILIDLGSKLGSHLDLNMRLSDIVLHYQKHCFVALQKNLIFMRVEILWRDCMFSHISSVDNAKTILNQYCLIECLNWINVRSATTNLAFLLHSPTNSNIFRIFAWLSLYVLLYLKCLTLFLQFDFNKTDHRPSACRLLHLKENLQ